ncbi:MAG: hypothetical protein H5T73_03645 [Actinobacteria bacterium]|nr:hypothetical protein [Actinomycetota bacterium]
MEKKRRKVSLVAALVVNVVTVIIVAIIIVAILLPGYRRSFTAARALKGAEEVWVVVRTSETTIRENSTDFTRAQDGLRNSLQELVGTGGENVYAFVRDGFPDQQWVEEHLPENMRKWLQELYPGVTPQNTGGTQPGTKGKDEGKDEGEGASQEVKP